MLTWKVLLIDDDEDDYLLTRDMLSNARSREILLTWASTYDQGRYEIGRGNYDVILVDYDLGTRNGLDLTREILSAQTDLPVILLTGRGSYEVDLEAMQAGVSLYLTKDEVNSLLLERSIRYAIERKQASQALRASEERFRQLADSMPQLVWTARSDGTVDYYNQRYREFAGIQPNGDQMESWVWAPVLHPDDVEKTMVSWIHAVSQGEVYQVEHRVRLADGSYRWFLSRGMPARDVDGRIVRWYGTATDIHDQKMAEENLRSRERLFEQLVSVIPLAIFTCDASGRIEFFNLYAVNLWGQKPVPGQSGGACVGGKHIRDMEGRIIPADQTPMAEVIRTRIGLRDQKFILERLDGGLRPVKADIEPLLNPHGDFIGTINILQEISNPNSGAELPRKA